MNRNQMPGRLRSGSALPPSAWLTNHHQGGQEFCRKGGSIHLSLDRGEGIPKRKGAAARRGLKEAWSSDPLVWDPSDDAQANRTAVYGPVRTVV